MTVKELIGALAGLDPEATVVVNMGKNELGNGCVAAKAEAAEAIRWRGCSQWNYNYYYDYDYDGYDDDDEHATVVNITC